MASTSRFNPVSLYMSVVAGAAAQASNKKAKQRYTDKLSDYVKLLGADPVDDYGSEKKVLNSDAMAHLVGVGSAIELIASMLTEISGEDDNSANAIAASGFTQYFAQYYCQTHGMQPKKPFPNTENLANKCNSQVIAPALKVMLKNVQKN
jgi:hypothetical protein